MFALAGSIARYPAKALVAYYLTAILIGGLLLAAPFSRVPDRPKITFVESYFTATSAVCVTGLSVRSTGDDFSRVGQGIILFLIQLGGIGIMTVTTFVMLLLTGEESLRYRATLAETLGARPMDRLMRVGLRVVAITLVIELIGTLVLYARFVSEGRPAPFWRALFHSVSAFCNAGFALDDTSLEAYRTDVTVNVTMMLLIIVGGIGFPVMVNLWRSVRPARRDARPVLFLRRYWDHLHLNSKLVLLGTLSFLALGTGLFLALEWSESLAGFSPSEKILISLFQSTTTRTAGFETVGLPSLTSATLFVMMLLMFVGSASCSTGGGAKVSTIVVLFLQAWNRLRGYRDVVAFRRTIPRETVERSNMIVMLFISFIVLGLVMVLVGGEAFRSPDTDIRGDHDYFLKVVFEVISALCTVGLSMGITAKLSVWSKCCLMVLMFIGRVGPVSVILAVARSLRDSRLKPANQDVLTG